AAGGRMRARVSGADNVQGVCHPGRTGRARGCPGRAGEGRPPGLLAPPRLSRARRRAARRRHGEAHGRGRRAAPGGADAVKLIYERSQPGRRASSLPRPDLPVPEVPAALRRAEPPRLPEVAEPELVRHFTELSTRTFGIDTGFYPL